MQRHTYTIELADQVQCPCVQHHIDLPCSLQCSSYSYTICRVSGGGGVQLFISTVSALYSFCSIQYGTAYICLVCACVIHTYFLHWEPSVFCSVTLMHVTLLSADWSSSLHTYVYRIFLCYQMKGVCIGSGEGGGWVGFQEYCYSFSFISNSMVMSLWVRHTQACIF